MITIAQLAQRIEDDLNALVPSDGGYVFKIWADVGKYKRYFRQGNKVTYYINGQLSVRGTALTPNALVMGVNGLTLEFLVPIDKPKTSYQQTDEELATIQNGQVAYIQEISGILVSYFPVAKSFSMSDDKGVNFNFTMYSGVATPNVVNLNTEVGVAMPMSVSITLNFGESLISGLDISVYLDGELVPYLTFNPSRAAQLATDLQSNAIVQKHVATSSAYGLQFTCPSSAGNAATAAVYDYIADPENSNMAHFAEVVWSTHRSDVYFTIFTSANGTVTGAEFAGLNGSMGEAYGNEELLSFPEGFEAGYFKTASSLAEELSFRIKATIIKTFAAGKVVPNTYALYYYIAGKAYKLTANLGSKTQQEDGSTVATYTVNAPVVTALNASDYVSDDDGNYLVYFVASNAVSISTVTSGFTYNEVS